MNVEGNCNSAGFHWCGYFIMMLSATDAGTTNHGITCIITLGERFTWIWDKKMLSECLHNGWLQSELTLQLHTHTHVRAHNAHPTHARTHAHTHARTHARTHAHMRRRTLSLLTLASLNRTVHLPVVKVQTHGTF